MKSEIDSNIFRAYDIRGIYGKDLTDEIMEKIGKALGTYMSKNSEILVGHDIRESSSSLSKFFVKGVVSTGVNVIDIGSSSFGLALFSGWKLKKDLTAYITASHNPPEWNGIKFFDKDMVGFFGKTIKWLEKIIRENNFNKGNGEIKKENLKEEYIQYLSSLFKTERKIKIVVDTGNGATSTIAPEIIKKAGYDIVELNTIPDPKFPGRGAGIEKENLVELKKMVVERGADFGVAFDGDGDRVIFVDEKGNFLSAEQITIILSRDMVKKKGEIIIANVETSMLLQEALQPLDVKIITVPVGHTYMGQETKKSNAIIGMEGSGHIIISKYLPFDDCMVSTLKIAKIISLSQKPLSEFLTDIPKYFKKEKVFSYSDEEKFKVVENIKKHIISNYKNVNIFDGIRVNFPDAWILIRASNTSPKIRFTVEAKTENRLNELINEFSGLFT